MLRILLLSIFSLFIFSPLLSASSDLENKIISKIIKEEKRYKKIVKKLDKVKKTLDENKKALVESSQSLEALEIEALELNSEKGSIEKEIIDFISKKYSLVVAIKQENKINENIAINKELYKIILDKAKNKNSKFK